MAQYIMFNNDSRTVATTDFEKDFFKLMNNSVFGKTIENIRNRVDIELVNSKKRCSKLVASRNFTVLIRINKNLFMVKKYKTNLVLNKPIFVGASVLEVSKWLIYDFHYGFTKRVWSNSNLFFADTDSLVYEIFADDVFQDAYNHRDQFDLVDVAKDDLFHDPTNKKVMGLMKDEFCFNVITEFVGLRSKMYSLKTASGEETKNLKGINKSIGKNNITQKDYLIVLFNNKEQNAKCLQSDHTNTR